MFFRMQGLGLQSLKKNPAVSENFFCYAISVILIFHNLQIKLSVIVYYSWFRCMFVRLPEQ